MVAESQDNREPRRPARRRRTVASESDTPFTGQALERGLAAVRAYRLSVYGLIPGVGLLLGPVSVVLALIVRLRNRRDPTFPGRALANAALVVGGLLTLTTWAGLVLMLWGLGVW